MDAPPSINELIQAGLNALGEIQTAAEQRFDYLSATALERDGTGRLSTGAKAARQALRNGALNTTLNARALATAGRAYKDKLEDVLPRALELVPDLISFFIAGQEFAIYSAAATSPAVPSRKRSPGGEIAQEWIEFIRKMEARGVAPSTMDQFNSFELDFLAEIYREKAMDARHRRPDGAWMTLVRAGGSQIPVDAWTTDEVEAITRATGEHSEMADAAVEWLNDLAGRPLDIPPAFCLSIVQNALADPEDTEPGFEKNRLTAAGKQWDADLAQIMGLLGVDASEIRRARNLMHPGWIHYEEAVAKSELDKRIRHARVEAQVKLYLGAAREVIEFEDREFRARHPHDHTDEPDAYEAQPPSEGHVRRMATVLVNSPEWIYNYRALGISMPDAVLVAQAADHAASLVADAQVPAETYPENRALEMSGDEAAAVAACLHDNDQARQDPLYARFVVAGDPIDQQLLISTLDEMRLAAPGDKAVTRFLAAARQGRTNDYLKRLREARVSELARLLQSRNETVIEAARSLGFI